MRGEASGFVRHAASAFQRLRSAQLTYQAAGSLLVAAGFTVLGLVNTVVLARVLGPHGLGAYSLALSLAMLVSSSLFAGMSIVIIRETAGLRQRGAAAESANLLQTMTALALGAGGALAIAGGGVLLSLRDSLSPELAGAIGWSLPLLPLLALMTVFGSTLRGEGRIVQGLMPDRIVRPAFLAVLLFGCVLLGVGLSAPGAMALHVLACVGALAYAAAVCGRPSVWWSARLMDTNVLAALTAVGPLALLSGLQVVNAQVDLILLGYLTSEEKVGIYRVALQCMLLLTALSTAIFVAVQPRIATFSNDSSRAQLQTLMRWTNVTVLIAILPLAVLFWWGGEWLLSILFGAQFAEATTAVAVLVAGQFAYAVFGPVQHALNMTGHERDTIAGLAAAATANVIACFLLIPAHGVTGAAVASVVGLLVWHAVLALLVKRRTGVDPTLIAIGAVWRRL